MYILNNYDYAFKFWSFMTLVHVNEYAIHFLLNMKSLELNWYLHIQLVGVAEVFSWKLQGFTSNGTNFTLNHYISTLAHVSAKFEVNCKKCNIWVKFACKDSMQSLGLFYFTQEYSVQLSIFMFRWKGIAYSLSVSLK